MTRKHFTAIADALGLSIRQNPQCEAFVFDVVVPQLSRSLLTFNPLFDRERFIERIEAVAFGELPV